MLKPCGARVWIKPDNVEEMDPIYAKAKKMGIELPKARELRQEQNAVVKATCVAIGPMCWQAPVGDGTPWCKVGDRIYIAKYSGAIVHDPENPDVEYWVVNDEDVVMVIEGENLNG